MSTTVEEAEKTAKDQMTNDALQLDSIEIKGYRCFEHLTVEKLGRVNLIVGKNNVGKTALLEALWIYLNRGAVIGQILSSRYEDRTPPNFSGPGTITQKNFFNRHSDSNTISIGPTNTDGLFVFDWDSSRGIGTLSSPKGQERNVLVGATGIDSQSVVLFWDKIELTEHEKDVKNAMRLISEDLVEVRLRIMSSNERIPFAQVRGLDQPLPLKSFGEGLNRLFGLALALVNCKDGVLLIDEVEGGFHYSILPDVWKLIFNTAKALNVQVFATTHSKDCIEAFAQAAVDSPEDGMLIRLEKQGERIVAKTLVEERLADAVNYDVDVR